jgi:transposase
MAKEPHLIQRLFRRLAREGAVAACYEAGVSGYDLYRQITACGVACQVIAPALTPRRPGQRIKTDRRDAAKLVRLFRAGELTAIHVPDEAERPSATCAVPRGGGATSCAGAIGCEFLTGTGGYVTGKN